MTDNAPKEDDLEPEVAAAESVSGTPSRWPSVLVGIATVLAIVSLFSIWGRTQSLDSGELSAGLVIGAAVALRHRTRDEFPDATAADAMSAFRATE